MEDKQIAIAHPTGLELPDRNTVQQQLRAVHAFQLLVKETLIEGHDFGTIPGTNKPTLLKPGAEKINKLLGLEEHYDILESTEDWDKPRFAYTVRSRLVRSASGQTVVEGLGECNSYESKYRWRYLNRSCPSCGQESIIQGKAEYGGGWVCFKKKGGCGAKFNDQDTSITGQKIGRVENDDIFSQVNTILKMAKKRALVDASLSAGRLSDIFTQDMEDLGNDKTEPTASKESPVEVPERPRDERKHEESSNPTEGPGDGQTAFWTWVRSQGKAPKDVTAVLGAPLVNWLREDDSRSYAQAKGVCRAQWQKSD